MQFTHEHREIQKTLQRFIEQEINPHVDAWEEAGIFPAHEVFKKLGDLGLLGLTKPEAYGGSGLDYSYSMVMAETLVRVFDPEPGTVGLATTDQLVPSQCSTNVWNAASTFFSGCQ